MRTILLAVAILTLTCVVSSADIFLTEGPVTVSGTTPSWSGSVSIPKFDPSWGYLLGITVALDSDLTDTNIGFENLDTSAHDITTAASASILLKRPDNTLITSTAPASTPNTFKAHAYDGSNDYNGPSGHTYPKIEGNDSNQYLVGPVIPAEDLLYFVGTGNVILNVDATQTAVANMFSGYNVNPGKFTINPLGAISSDAHVTVTYDYRTFVPEPGSAALLLLGLPMAGVWFRRRRK